MMQAIVHESAKDDQWYAEFKGENNETWFVSEGYTTQASGIRSVEDFYTRIGATNPVEIKVINKQGTLQFTQMIHGPASG